MPTVDDFAKVEKTGRSGKSPPIKQKTLAMLKRIQTQFGGREIADKKIKLNGTPGA